MEQSVILKQTLKLVRFIRGKIFWEALISDLKKLRGCQFGVCNFFIYAYTDTAFKPAIYAFHNPTATPPLDCHEVKMFLIVSIFDSGLKRLHNN